MLFQTLQRSALLVAGLSVGLALSAAPSVAEAQYDEPALDIEVDLEGGFHAVYLRSSDFDTRLRVFDSEGDLVAENDDFEPDESFDSRVVGRPDAGSYKIEVSSVDGSGGAFELTILPLNAIGEPEMIEGELVGGDEDHYELSLAGGWLIAVLISDDFDSYLTLLDADGDPVAADDDSATPGELHALLFHDVDEASYTLVATSYDDAPGAYRLLIVQVEPGEAQVMEGELAVEEMAAE